MKYHQIDRQLYIKNRAKFTAQMKPNSVAVFNSNDIYPVSADLTLPFSQHRDILYLSGVDQEESILLLFPDAPYETQREILFLKETSEHIAVWEGEKLTKKNFFFVVSGVKTVLCHIYETKTDLSNKKFGILAYISGSKSKVFEGIICLYFRLQNYLKNVFSDFICNTTIS